MPEKKEDPAKCRALTFTDVIFFIAKNQVIHIGTALPHGLTTFPGEYIEGFMSNATKRLHSILCSLFVFRKVFFVISRHRGPQQEQKDEVQAAA